MAQMAQLKKGRFLEVLAATGNVQRAARVARCARRTLYRYRACDPAFRQAWEQALGVAMDLVLEPEALRRAVEGVERPVYQGGKQVGTIREYSDTLLIFLLKGGKKEKYAERRESIPKGMIVLLHKMEHLMQMTTEEREAVLGEIETYIASTDQR
jgi:hypothetical protein